MTHPDWLDTRDLPEWVHWIAQDADGQWWGYEVEPLQYHAGWYENELGRNLALQKEQPNAHWARCLLRIK